jgi:hypothetical protein
MSNTSSLLQKLSLCDIPKRYKKLNISLNYSYITHDLPLEKNLYEWLANYHVKITYSYPVFMLEISNEKKKLVHPFLFLSYAQNLIRFLYDTASLTLRSQWQDLSLVVFFFLHVLLIRKYNNLHHSFFFLRYVMVVDKRLKSNTW